MFFFLFTLPIIIGLFSILFLEKRYKKLGTVLYRVMMGLAVPPFLMMLWTVLWCIGWNSGFVEIFLIVGSFIAFGGQLGLLAGFHIQKKIKARRIIGLTIMATPLVLMILTDCLAGLMDIYIRTD